MKNKLKKRHQTKFDYTMKKLGAISFVLILLAFTVVVPLASHLEKENKAINQNIELLEKQDRLAKPISKYREFLSK